MLFVYISHQNKWWNWAVTPSQTEKQLRFARFIYLLSDTTYHDMINVNDQTEQSHLMQSFKSSDFDWEFFHLVFVSTNTKQNHRILENFRSRFAKCVSNTLIAFIGNRTSISSRFNWIRFQCWCEYFVVKCQGFRCASSLRSDSIDDNESYTTDINSSHHIVARHSKCSNRFIMKIQLIVRQWTMRFET